jgi:hypothetical protein
MVNAPLTAAALAVLIALQLVGGVAQVAPENPFLHAQVYALTPSLQVPPLRHGFAAHSSMFVSHVFPL